MTPEPTPVGGMTPRLPVSVAPVTRILTTAGLTFDATAMVADDSSIATGWRAPALVDWGAVTAATGRSRAPTALSARTVPPEARTADSSAAASNDPPLPSPRVVLVGTAVAAGVGAGSYQRSGVTGGASSQERAQSERVSGAGV